MVDRDKIRDRTSQKQKPDEKNKTRSKNSGDSNSTSTGQNIDLDENVGGDTYEDKMDKLKGTSSNSATSTIKRSQAAKVLESIANILFYTEGKMRSYGEPSSKRETVEINVTSTIYEQFTEFVATCNVQAICEKYGIDWTEDVLNKVIAEQDFEGDVDNIASETNTVVNVGSGKKFSKEHFHQLLMCLGYMFMFIKTVEKKYEDENTPESKMAISAIEDVSAKCIDFIGTFNVREIAKDNGISFDRDVLDKLASGEV